jgi:hypothetical protein
LNDAATEADLALAAALDDEAVQTGEATDAETAAAQALATEGLATDEVNTITGIREAAQVATDEAAVAFTNEDQERTDSDAEADAAEAELDAAEDALDNLN